ncbi:hypothetical protein [Halogeometricum borinquense]|uniref:hypothetical protein n=1 Tax=Halogeometricum borinquense TaxID=60847 RepID=UPI0003235EE5|nr:hypothetical protein [Halogeometricum borinquense]
MPTAVAIPDSHTIVTADGITDETIAERTRQLGRELVEYAGVAQYPKGSVQPIAVAEAKQGDS